MQAIKDKLTSTRTHIIAAILSLLGYLGVIGLSSRAVVMGDIGGSNVQYPMATSPVPVKSVRGLVTESEAVIRRRAIFKVIPMYYSTGRNRPHGIVTVRVTIDEDGTVANAESLSGNSPLKELAEEAARQWKFEPALADGRPIKVESTLTFRFKN
jgi:TonB family protein